MKNSLFEHFEQKPEQETETINRFLDYKNIYKDIENQNNQNVELKSFAKNRKLQNLLNQNLTSNTRFCFYGFHSKTRSIDYGEYKFFDNNKIEDFLFGNIDIFTLSPPEQLSSEKEISLDKIKADYSDFYYKQELIDYEENEIEWKIFAEKINRKLNARFKIIKKIMRKSEEYQRETGNWIFYLSWPFIEGRVNKRVVRTPFMFQPVKAHFKNNRYILTKTNDKIMINSHLIRLIYSDKRETPVDLELYFEKKEDIFKEYYKHGIVFKNQLEPIESFKRYTTLEFDEKLDIQINSFQLKNYAIFENITWSLDIYNDLMRISRDFEELSLPEKTIYSFYEKSKEKSRALLPFNIDNNKNYVVSSSYEDSVTISGPPGTGKSEVITSILVNNISNNKKTLVVSEKDVALEVLVERLKKYNLELFALKINDNSLNKKNFWNKIEKVINKIKFLDQDYQIQKPIMPSDHIELLLKFNKYLKEVNTSLGNEKFTNFKEEIFYKGVLEIQEYEKILDKKKPISNQIYAAKLEFENYKKNLIIFKEQFEGIEKTILEIDSFNNKYKELKDELMNLLKPPLCYIPQTEIDFKQIWNIKNNHKKMFYFLNNGHYTLFNRKNAFKVHRNLILNLVDKLNIFVSMHDNKENTIHLFNEKIENLKLNKSKTEKEINQFKIDFLKIIDFNQLEELLSISDKRILQLNKIENIYHDFYDEKFTDFQQNFKKYDKKMKNAFQKSNDYFLNSTIYNIKNNIRNNNEIRNVIQYLYQSTKMSIKRRLSHKKIIKEYFDVISTLFPILISTPVEVSKFLPNDSNIFDYGVFDEASQMFIERAYPSIHRSKKVIIAGDEKQLAPSNFFQGSKDTYYDETEISLEDSVDYGAKSLLEWGKLRYKEKLLKWHYRSSNAKLIEYSNIHFYNGELIAANSPLAITNPIEIKKIDGIWEEYTNVQEAEYIIEILKKFTNKSNYKKIGIITMNYHQKELIMTLLEKENDLQKIYLNYDEEKRIFVKNIENVQGDEADLIIFSLAYAPIDGKLKLGPLTFLTTNRLNVAITRAKHKMIVVKSFDSSDLGVGTPGTGRNILYNWVKWLEEENKTIDNSLTDKVKNHKNKFRSPFEEEYYEKIKLKLPDNLIVRTNYYINGQELDIIIFDLFESKFVAAIELDGKMYHSDPDQITMDIEKTKFLESIGWNIIRISSTEFWKNKDKCVDDTIKKLKIDKEKIQSLIEKEDSNEFQSNISHNNYKNLIEKDHNENQNNNSHNSDYNYVKEITNNDSWTEKDSNESQNKQVPVKEETKYDPWNDAVYNNDTQNFTEKNNNEIQDNQEVPNKEETKDDHWNDVFHNNTQNPTEKDHNENQDNQELDKKETNYDPLNDAVYNNDTQNFTEKDSNESQNQEVPNKQETKDDHWNDVFHNNTQKPTEKDNNEIQDNQELVKKETNYNPWNDAVYNDNTQNPTEKDSNESQNQEVPNKEETKDDHWNDVFHNNTQNPTEKDSNESQNQEVPNKEETKDNHWNDVFHNNTQNSTEKDNNEIQDNQELVKKETNYDPWNDAIYNDDTQNSTEKDSNESQNDVFNNNQDWIEVVPEIGSIKIRRNIKISGKFEFNHFKNLFKVHKHTTFEGVIKNDLASLNWFKRFFNKYKYKNIISISSYFNIKTNRYSILFIKEKQFLPSTLNFFTRAGLSEVNTLWKTKKTNLFINDMNWTVKEIENETPNIFIHNDKQNSSEKEIENETPNNYIHNDKRNSLEKEQNLIEKEIENETQNVFLHNDNQEWIEIIPVIGDVEIKRNIKISGKFEFNRLKNVIKVYKKSILEGTLKDDQASLDRFNRLFSLYKDQKFFSDSSYFDNQTKKYKIFFIKNKRFRPSTLNFYTRAATNDDQTIWKNKKTNLFIDNFEPIKSKYKKKY